MKFRLHPLAVEDALSSWESHVGRLTVYPLEVHDVEFDLFPRGGKRSDHDDVPAPSTGPPSTGVPCAPDNRSPRSPKPRGDLLSGAHWFMRFRIFRLTAKSEKAFQELSGEQTDHNIQTNDDDYGPHYGGQDLPPSLSSSRKLSKDPPHDSFATTDDAVQLPAIVVEECSLGIFVAKTGHTPEDFVLTIQSDWVETRFKEDGGGQDNPPVGRQHGLLHEASTRHMQQEETHAEDGKGSVSSTVLRRAALLRTVLETEARVSASGLFEEQTSTSATQTKSCISGSTIAAQKRSSTASLESTLVSTSAASAASHGHSSKRSSSPATPYADPTEDVAGDEDTPATGLSFPPAWPQVSDDFYEVHRLLRHSASILRQNNALWLLYAILSNAVDNMIPIGDAIQTHLNRVSSRLFVQESRIDYAEVKTLILLRRHTEWLHSELRPLLKVIRFVEEKVGLFLRLCMSECCTFVIFMLSECCSTLWFLAKTEESENLPYSTTINLRKNFLRGFIVVL